MSDDGGARKGSRRLRRRGQHDRGRTGDVAADRRGQAVRAAQGRRRVHRSASGRRIVTILRKKQAERTADDEQHMRKVVGYVHRHLKQVPDGDITETTWRYSLMNWGHDPNTS